MPNDNVVLPSKGRNLTEADKKAAHSMITGLAGHGTPPRGVFPVVAAHFSVGRHAIARLWKRVQVEANKVKDANNDANNDADGDDNHPTISEIPSAAFATKIHQRRTGKHKHNREEIKARQDKSHSANGVELVISRLSWSSFNPLQCTSSNRMVQSPNATPIHSSPS